MTKIALTAPLATSQIKLDFFGTWADMVRRRRLDAKRLRGRKGWISIDHSVRGCELHVWQFIFAGSTGKKE